MIFCEELKEYAKNAMEYERAIGMSMAAIDVDDDLHKNTICVEYENFGFADQEGNVQASKETLYQVGSTTKAFTALAVLLLEDDGKLSLEDYVSKYVPEITLYYEGERTEITVSQLIHHSSGISDQNYYAKIPEGNQRVLREQTIHMLNGMKLRFQPGTKVEYSNLGYDLLGAVIEAAGEMEYEQFIKERILIPIGMVHSTCSLDEAMNSGMLAKQYMPYCGRGVEHNPPFYYGAVPDGYLMSTAEDMHLWLKAQMGLLKIPEQIAKAIERSHIVDTEIVYQVSPKKGLGYYTYGWIVFPKVGEIMHTGLNSSFCSCIFIRTIEHKAVCALSNSPVDHVSYSSAAVMCKMLGKPLPALRCGSYRKQDCMALIITVAVSIAAILSLIPMILWKCSSFIPCIIGMILGLGAAIGILLFPKLKFGVHLRYLWYNNPRTIVTADVTASIWFFLIFSVCFVKFISVI